MKTVVVRALLSFSLCVYVEYEAGAAGNVTVAYDFYRARAAGRSGRRLFNGAPARLSELPSVCALATGERHVSCSGALVHARWALTAAHCVDPTVALVLYGTTSPMVGGGAAKVHSQYRHPEFRMTKARTWFGEDVVELHHDVGLVHTHQSMPPADEHLLTALRLHDLDELIGSEIRVLGFGRTELAGPGEHLMGAALRLARCERSGYQHCACARAAGIGACAGDSGGPVLYRGTLVGVTSLGPSQCWTLPFVEALSVVTVTRPYGDLIANTVRAGAGPRMLHVYSGAAVRARALRVVAACVTLRASIQRK